MQTLRIPTPLRPYTNGMSEIEFNASTVAKALEELTTRYPSLHPHLFSEDGELRAFVNLFVNDEEARHLNGMETILEEDDRLMIIPSIAGGI
jgi:adenylyltransferase/sulfurtransferase